MAYDDRALVGIGGWLAFLVITLILTAVANFGLGIATLSALPDLSPRFGVNWTIYLAVSWLLVAIRVLGYAALAWLLNSRQNTATPRIVIVSLWILALSPLAVDLLLAIGLLGLDPGQTGPVILDAVRPIIYSAVWTAYLLTSRRVANTYSDDPIEE